MGFHFNIAREDLLRAITAQQNITNKGGLIAILSNVFLEVENNNIIFTGTDLDIGLRQTIPAEVFETGNLTLPSKKLFELARESSSDIVNFKENEKFWVDITAGSSSYKLAGTVSDEFPEFPNYDMDSLVNVEGDIMGDMIDKTVYSIAQDKENKFTLEAALFQKIEENGKNILRMISSDGHRLSIMSKETESAGEMVIKPLTLIPRRGIIQMRKFIDELDTFQMTIEKKQAVLKSEDSLLIIRLMEGDFPDYENILKAVSMDNKLLIKKNSFLESLKRINLFTDEDFHTIKFEIITDKLILTSQNADFGSARDEIEIEYSGDDMTMGFNCRFFIETLQIMEGDVIEASISSENSPCLITSEEDDGFLSIIMPMKL